MKNLVAPTDVTVDVGAYHGLYTGVLARAVGKHGHVHAFEPNPRHWERLALLARAYGNITVHPLALSETAGRAALRIPIVGGRELDSLASLSGALTGEQTTAVAVPVSRLDDVLPSDRSISFLKCDVEGHEAAVLFGAQQTLARGQPSLLIEIEERHKPGALGETLRLLEPLRYQGYFFRGNNLRPIQEFDLEQDQLQFVGMELEEIMPPDYVCNFLFVRRAQHIEHVRHLVL
jgi:FkbM family methyltransferase